MENCANSPHGATHGPRPFVFYRNPPLPGPEDTRAQGDGPDRREGGWWWLLESEMCYEVVQTKTHFIYSTIIPRGGLRCKGTLGQGRGKNKEEVSADKSICKILRLKKKKKVTGFSTAGPFSLS